METRDPLSITIGQSVAVLNGTRISIECPASGVPKPAVSWNRKGEPLKSGQRHIIEESVLVIKRVIIEDTGVYSCRAVNPAGDYIGISVVNVTGRSLHIS